MSFFSKFSDFIKSPVGNALTNLPEDVRKVKHNLSQIGIFNDDTDNGYITRDLDDAIKTFQSDNGLKVDGRINPRGETESRIWDVLSGGLEKIDKTAKQTRVIEEKPRSIGIDFGTSITDFKIDRRPSGHTIFIPEKDQANPIYDFGRPPKPEPRGPFVFALNNKKPQTDATGRMIREKTPPIPERKPVLTTQLRKEAILRDKGANFKIVSNPDADGRKPLHTIDAFSEVKPNEKTIEREAAKAGVDPEMVKAIVYLETTQGYYDGIAKKLGIQNKTIRPMNVHAEYWKDLGFSREDLNDPEKNIQAGTKLLKRVKESMPGASAAKIATVYNNLGARKVSDYGARVERLMKEKPWEK